MKFSEGGPKMWFAVIRRQVNLAREPAEANSYSTKNSRWAVGLLVTWFRAGPKKSRAAAREYPSRMVPPKHAPALPSLIGHRGNSPPAGRCGPSFITLFERPST